MQRFKKGDLVQVIAGKETGKQSKITKIGRKKGDVVYLENLNKGKRHTKRSQTQNGGIVDIFLPIAISNVALVCEHCKSKVKIKVSILDNGKKVRECKKCNRSLDNK